MSCTWEPVAWRLSEEPLMKFYPFQRSIQAKIILAFLLVGSLPVVVGLALTYYNGTTRLREAIGENFRGLALEVSRKADLMIEKELLSMQHLSATLEIQAAVEESNLLFRSLLRTQISGLIARNSKTWADENDPFFRHDLIGNQASLGLQKNMLTRRDRPHAFLVTNETGVLVGSINEMPHFFNGTEDWWRETYDGGRGKDYIGNLYFNEQTQSFSIIIATPIMDREGIEAIGVLAVFHDVRRFLDSIVSVVRFGKTGHAMLVDSDGRVIVCPVMPTGTVLQNKKLVNAITSFAPEWVLAKDDGHGGMDSIIGFAPLVTTTNITLDSTGNSWHSFIRQDPKELYAPLNSLLMSVFLSGVLLLGVVAVLGVFLSGRITRPIKILEEGADEISKGNLNVSVNINSGDEIGKLAQAFNNMALKLSESYSNLEQKVKDRTKELSALNLIAMTINQSLELKHILESTVKKVLEALELESGAVWLWDAKKENLEIQFSQGLPPDFVQETRKLSLNEIEERYFLKSGTPGLLEGMESPIPYADLLSGKGFSAVLAVSLRSKDKNLGFILIASRGSHIFTFQDRELLDAMGGELSVAIENAMLYAETREMVQKLKEADQFKTEFFSNVTHELRTPLTSIIGHSEFLLEEFNAKLTSKQKESIGNIQLSGKYLLEIVNNLLDLSRIRAQKMELHHGEFSARSVLVNCIKAVNALAIKNNLTIKMDIKDKGLILNGDEIKVRQIILNLLSNAIKFTPQGGTITVGARHREDMDPSVVEISVTDTGIGISPRDFGKIFEEFRQADSSHTREFRGSGLGLPIAKRFAEMHGGRLEVESEVAKGSCFTLILPTKMVPEKEENPA